MSKNAEQSNDQSSDDKDFNSLSLEQMREAINNEAEESAKEDQDQKNSEENQEEDSKDQESDSEQSSEGESSEEAKEDSDNSDSETKDEADKQNETKPEVVSREEHEKLQKNYKALQREFTKRNQARTKEVPEKKEQSSEGKKSVIDQIRSKNPDAAKIFEALKEEAKAEAKAEFEKELEPIKTQLTVREQTENIKAFSKAIDDFSKSELAELTPEVEAKLNDMFEDKAQLQEAVKRDPSLFEKIKKEVISENFVKAAELVNKKKSGNSQKREKEIANAKVVTKSKTSSESKNYEDLKEFKKLTSEQMRKLLPKSDE